MIISSKCTNPTNKCLKSEDTSLINKVNSKKECKAKISLVKVKESKEPKRNHKSKKPERNLNFKPKDLNLKLEWIRSTVKTKLKNDSCIFYL